MKKIFGAIFVSMFLGMASAYAVEGDITVSEVRPNVATLRLRAIEINFKQKVAVITYGKRAAGGASIGRKRIVTFNNIGGTGFDDLIAKINTESNIAVSVSDAVEIKEGL